MRVMIILGLSILFSGRLYAQDITKFTNSNSMVHYEGIDYFKITKTDSIVYKGNTIVKRFRNDSVSVYLIKVNSIYIQSIGYLNQKTKYIGKLSSLIYSTNFHLKKDSTWYLDSSMNGWSVGDVFLDSQHGLVVLSSTNLSSCDFTTHDFFVYDYKRNRTLTFQIDNDSCLNVNLQKINAKEAYYFKRAAIKDLNELIFHNKKLHGGKKVRGLEIFEILKNIGFVF